MKSMLLIAAILPLATAQEKPATATWIADPHSANQGQAIRTVIQMQVAEGWHTYWENPGEGGLPLSLKATLPDGWVIGEIGYPAPIRFVTGDLPGFGYEGEIHFPVTLTPPPGFHGEMPSLSATLSWLTCNDETCLPGKAEMTLAAGDEDTIAKAYAALPKPLPGATLTLAAEGENILLRLTAPQDFDPSVLEIFPATRNILDPAAKPRFSKATGNIWTATAPKSGYLDGEPKELKLVLAAPGKGAWSISTGGAAAP